MIGLLIKDLKLIKKQAVIFLVLGVIYIVIGFQSGNFLMFGAFMTMLCAILPLTTLAYDEYSKWDKYALATSVSRAEIVLSKYIMGIALSGAVMVISAAVSAISTPIDEAICSSALVFILGVVFLSFILPICFKLGVEKARILMMLMIVIPIIVGIVFANMHIELPQLDIVTATLIAALCAALIAAISLALSIKFYSKKDIS